MKKIYIFFVVVFAVLLLLPFSVQTVADLRGEKRFVSLDIFKDIVYTPFVRESRMVDLSTKLNDAVNPLPVVAMWASRWKAWSVHFPI